MNEIYTRAAKAYAGQYGDEVTELTAALEILWSKVGQRADLERASYYQDLGLTDRDIRDLQRPAALRLCFFDNTNAISLTEEASEMLDDIRRNIDPLPDKIEYIDIDLETYSEASIKDCGVYRYVEDPSFEIILFAYAINGGPVRIIDLAQGEQVPDKILTSVIDEKIVKIAHNAAFERICLSKYMGLPLGTYLNAKSWQCTMVAAARLGLPLSLDQLGEVLGIERKKMKEGKALITYFSTPCKPTKVNGGRTRNLPQHAPEKWRIFKKYCIRDVEAEQEIGRKVLSKPVAPWDRKLWELDQRINDRGVLVDIQMAQTCQRLDAEVKEELIKEAQRITGLANPNSIAQLKQFIKDREGFEITALGKTELPGIMDRCKDNDTRRLLKIRQEVGKTSSKKYTTMLKCACHDGRIRGILQFCGAARTGRWAGRLVQMQNLPQNHIPDLEHARDLVKAGDLEDIEIEYCNVTQLLSELIRTAFIAKPGCTFHVCDFSAIECRVLAWLAKEDWVLDTFRAGGDIYCATASKMFGVPVEKHGRNAELRQKGKIATLALGYEGGVGALAAMGGERMGLTKEEMAEIVQTWRLANPHIVRFWHTIEAAAKYVVQNQTETEIPSIGLKFKYIWGGLQITLPSGRYIFYPRMRWGLEKRNPALMPGKGRARSMDKESLIYEGQNQNTKKWEEIPTYGGKMTENITQAVARDILGMVMLRMDDAGMNIVFHVHDEDITEARPDQTLEQIEKIFATPIDWAPDLPLKGAGYTTPFYMKD